MAVSIAAAAAEMQIYKCLFCDHTCEGDMRRQTRMVVRGC